MQKSRLGISVGLLCSGVFFVGIIDFTAFIILAGYVLLFENNEWLKENAIKALKIVIGFSIVSPAIVLLQNVLEILNRLFSTYWYIPSNVVSVILTAVAIAKALMLFIYGFKAFAARTSNENAVSNGSEETM